MREVIEEFYNHLHPNYVHEPGRSVNLSDPNDSLLFDYNYEMALQKLQSHKKQAIVFTHPEPKPLRFSKLH